MNDLETAPEARRLPASELRKLPLDERAAVLQPQAALAEAIYRQDPSLTDFEAFDEGEIHGDGAVPEAG